MEQRHDSDISKSVSCTDGSEVDHHGGGISSANGGDAGGCACASKVGAWWEGTPKFPRSDGRSGLGDLKVPRMVIMNETLLVGADWGCDKRGSGKDEIAMTLSKSRSRVRRNLTGSGGS